MKLTCNVVRDLVAVYTDGAASEETRRAISTHLAECPACARYFYDYARIAKKHRGVRRSPVKTADDGYHALSDRLRRHRSVATAIQIAALVGIVGGAVIALFAVAKRK